MLGYILNLRWRRRAVVARGRRRWRRRQRASSSLSNCATRVTPSKIWSRAAASAASRRCVNLSGCHRPISASARARGGVGKVRDEHALDVVAAERAAGARRRGTATGCSLWRRCGRALLSARQPSAYASRAPFPTQLRALPASRCCSSRAARSASPRAGAAAAPTHAARRAPPPRRARRRAPRWRAPTAPPRSAQTSRRRPQRHRRRRQTRRKRRRALLVRRLLAQPRLPARSGALARSERALTLVGPAPPWIASHTDTPPRSRTPRSTCWPHSRASRSSTCTAAAEATWTAVRPLLSMAFMSAPAASSARKSAPSAESRAAACSSVPPCRPSAPRAPVAIL